MVAKKCGTRMLIGFLGAALTAGAAAQANVLPAIVSDNNDGSINGTAWNGGATGPSNVGDNSVHIGSTSSTDFKNAVFPFLLPSLPAGQVVQSAQFNLDLQFTQGDVSGFGADASVLRISSSPTIQTSDYTEGTLLTANYFTSSSPSDYGALDTPGQNTLGSYLAANYIAGDFIFIAVNANAPVDTSQNGGNDNYLVKTSETSSDTPPILTITTTAAPVPEPASLSILGLSSLFLLKRKSR